MDRIAKALAEHDEVFAEINDVLFGGGAEELISKLTERQKFERRQAQVGLATNVVGITAGTAATIPATKNYLAARRKFNGIPEATPPKHKGVGRIRGIKAVSAGESLLKKPRVGVALAAGAGGLQIANLSGDLVANRVLNRASKKPKEHVGKAGPDQADLHVMGGSVKYKAAKKASRKVTPVLKVKTEEYLQTMRKIDETSSEIVWEGEISKVDDDKRQVFGYCSVTKIGGVDVVDKQDDHIDIEEVEKAAYKYVMNSRKGGDMHRRVGEEPFHASDLIESLVITDEKVEKMGLPPDINRGWWVGFQVHDEDTWKEVKAGKRKAFSIHGRGSRVEKVLENAV